MFGVKGAKGTCLVDKGTCLGDKEISERTCGAAFCSQCRSGWGRRVVCGWEIRVRVWWIRSTRLGDNGMWLGDTGTCLGDNGYVLGG